MCRMEMRANGKSSADDGGDDDDDTHTHICTVHAFTTPKTKTLLHGCMDAYTHNKEAIVSSIVSMEILAKIAYPTNSPDSNQKLRPPQPN